MMLKDLLLQENCSIVASNGYVSFASGIKPLIEKLNEDLYYFKSLEVADKVVGKAAAMLFVLSGVKKVYAHVLSKAGEKILKENNIEYEYGQLVENIINRSGDDICPMEKTVKDIDDYNEAYIALKNKIALH